MQNDIICLQHFSNHLSKKKEKTLFNLAGKLAYSFILGSSETLYEKAKTMFM
jgi:hypothetical protein